MKPKFHQVPKTLDYTFSIRHDIMHAFGTTWHYHPEIELHYMIKGEGIRFIGENISNFEKDELILLGANTPHTWKCNSQNKEDFVEAYVLHFHPKCLGTTFLSIPETKKIEKLFQAAKQGLIFYGESKTKVVELLHQLNLSEGLSRIILILQIFDILSQAQEYHIISSQYDSTGINKSDEQRFNKVLTYTFSNFKNKIYIEEVADLCNLSVTSFCRYFKSVTKKSYFDFLTELRLNYACRQLISTDLPVKNIAESSGFENTSNFYRHFKRMKNMKPNEYKKLY